MKPDWSKAPPWANWWSIDEADEDGFSEIAWTDKEPRLLTGFWFPGTDEIQAEYDYTMHYTGEAYKEQRP